MEVQTVEGQLWDLDSSTGNKSDKSQPDEQESTEDDWKMLQ
jgi:hypothetical protein